MKKTKKITASVVAAALVMAGAFSGLPGAVVLGSSSITAYAGTLDDSSYTWSEDSTITGDLTINGYVSVSEDVTLTIPAEKTLTVNGSISIANDKTLTVTGTGTLTVNGSTSNNAITTEYSGTLVVNGATVNATGGNGIGDSLTPDGIQAKLIVNSGTVIATGGKGGDVEGEPCAGRGGYGISFEPTINGGTVIATGGEGGKATFMLMERTADPGEGMWNPMYRFNLGAGVKLYGSNSAMPAGE